MNGTNWGNVAPGILGERALTLWLLAEDVNAPMELSGKQQTLDSMFRRKT
jgi:hypothetical protein